MKVLFFFCLLAAATPSWAQDQVPAHVNVELGKVTEVVFPDKVAKVIKGGQPDSILIEVLDSSVYLLPKVDALPDIFITTQDGQSYPMILHMSSDHDVRVQIGAAKQISSHHGAYTDAMSLMKDLLLGKELPMATILPESGEVFLSNHEIRLTVEQAYELRGWKAYVLKAQNLINNAVIVPIEQISLPNLLAISSDRDMLAAQGCKNDATMVYLVIAQ